MLFVAAVELIPVLAGAGAVVASYLKDLLLKNSGKETTISLPNGVRLKATNISSEQLNELVKKVEELNPNPSSKGSEAAGPAKPGA